MQQKVNNQRRFVAEPSEYPMRQKFDFSKTRDERLTIEVYKANLGITLKRKPVTVLKAQF